MNKEFLKECLLNGMTHRQIAEISGKSKTTVGYWITKYELNNLSKYKKPTYIDEHQFNKIDTKEKAYIIGYALADAYISNKSIEFGCCINDKEILKFISRYTGANYREDLTFNKSQKRFPRARINIGNKSIITDFNKHCSSKENKHCPHLSKQLERYLVQGFFDGDGCITFGRRKDRNRLWHKISFTSSLKVLQGIQNILLKQCNISSVIRPKSNENCYVLEFANKKDVIKFLNFIYPNNDFIVLKRKYNKAQALRLELGEFGERLTTPSEANN